MWEKKSKYRITRRKPQKILQKLQKRRKTGKKPSKISEKRQKNRTIGKNRRKCSKKCQKCRKNVEKSLKYRIKVKNVLKTEKNRQK